MTTETQCTCLDADQIAAGSRVVAPEDPTSHAHYCPRRDTKSKALMDLERGIRHVLMDSPHRDALLASLAEARNESASLREMLRLANDKMAEQVRQARWEVADEALTEVDLKGTATQFLARVHDANAPKD